MYNKPTLNRRKTLTTLSYLKYILPILTGCFVIYIAWHFTKAFFDKEDGSKLRSRISDDDSGADFRFKKADLIAVLLITGIYSVIAFTALGDKSAPESPYAFPSDNSSIEIHLSSPEKISQVAAFHGLHTGDIKLEFLYEDAKDFSEVGHLNQDYSQLFKWRYAEITNSDFNTPVAAIRLTASRALNLNELAILDWDGNALNSEKIVMTAEIAPLFDENELLPLHFSFLNSSYFDEIYHARTALEHIEGVWPYEITHPPLGKILIALGIELFGMNPFGWRFSGTVCGILMLPILYFFLKALFGNFIIPFSGTLIFAADFMHFTQTRIATIDSFSVFFILLMYYFFWLYFKKKSLWGLALSGIAFGLGAATKWTCIYAGGGLFVLWILKWIMRRKEEKLFRSFVLNSLFCLVFFVAVPLFIYYLSYIPYGVASGLDMSRELFSKRFLDIVLNNQKTMFTYHSGLVATHPYSSKWYEWIFDARPILYFLDTSFDGAKSSIAAFQNPLLSWLGLFAILGTGFFAGLGSSKARFILIGYLAQLLPWILVSRLTFAYHYFPSSLFLLLAVMFMFDELRRQELPYKRLLISYSAVSLAVFILFYPVLSGMFAPIWYNSYLLKWFPAWPV